MHDFRYTKADRLRKRSEYLLLSRSGCKIQNRHFILLYCPGRTEKSRLGITATKRIVGKAAARNRIKRCVREFFRVYKATAPGCWDVNVIAKKAALALNCTNAWDSLESLFDRLPQGHADFPNS